jgi:hypothetical protein
MIQTAMNQAFLDLDKKIERHENEIKELVESKYKSLDGKNDYIVKQLSEIDVILKDLKISLNEIKELIKSKHEEVFKETKENYKKSEELEEKVERIVKLLKEPLTDEDLK